MTVKEDSKVTINYTGRIPDTQEVFDTSREDVAKENKVYTDERDYEPLEVEMGKDQVIPGFEKALKGMEAGETKKFTLGPEEAYGQPDPENVTEVPDQQFKENDIEVQVGGMIQTQAGIAKITNYEGDKVTLDFNHPLAGEELEFEIEVLNIE